MATNNLSKRTINYVDGLCGSGKTHTLGQYIKGSTNDKKFLIITPSKLLIDEIHKDFTGLGIKNVHKVYSEFDSKSDNVVSQIMRQVVFFNSLGEGVIICTQKAYSLLPYLENQNEWILIIDEIPKVDNFDSPTLPYSHPLLVEHIDVGNIVATSMYTIRTKQPSNSKPNYDTALKEVSSVIDDLYSSNYLCLTDKKNWDKVVVNNSITDDNTVDTTYGNYENKLYFLRLLQPSIFDGFSSVIMMGANFRDSILYMYWSEYCHVNFQPFNPICNNLRYGAYKNGERLKVIYLQEEDWSKHCAAKQIHGKSRLNYYAEMVENHFGDKKFMYMTNNSDDTVFNNGVKVPVISHGLNSYQHHHNVYFSPALNNQPKYTSMLVDLGFNKEFIKRAVFHEVLHQGVMRSSLRNPNASEPVTVIVVDKSSAESLARLFPGCSIGAIDGCLRKVMPLTQVDKNRNLKLRKLIDQKDLNSIVITSLSRSQNNFSQKKVTKSYIEGNGNQNILDYAIGITCLSDIFNKITTDYKSSPMDFIATMKDLYSNHVVNNKHENLLFSGATYKTNESRKLNDVSYASFVVIDIDNGDLSPEEFFDIFTKFHKHSFFMCNSFSRSAEKPNNYRAVFFINQVVTDIIYRDIQDYIMKIIENHGYITCTDNSKVGILLKNPNAKFSGIDLSKTHTASFFYLPCKVRGREDWAFFRRGNVKDIHELIRYAIDVSKLIKYSRDDFTLPILAYESTESVEIDREDIKRHIMQSTNLKNLGNHNTYFRIAAAMRNSGFSRHDFVEITPFISESKSRDDAIKYWSTCGSYQDIRIGTLLHLINYKKAA